MPSNLNVDADWDTISHAERQLRLLWQYSAELTAAKATGDRLTAGSIYEELASLAMHATNPSLRRSASRIVDPKELAWYRDELKKSAPIEEWLIEMRDAYAIASKAKRRTILARIRKVADNSSTPQSARRDLLEFLASPQAWYAARDAMLR